MKENNESKAKHVAKRSAPYKISLDWSSMYLSEITVNDNLVANIYAKTKKLCSSRAKVVHQALIKHQIENE